MVTVLTDEEYKGMGLDSVELSEIAEVRESEKEFYERVKAVWPTAQYLHLFVDYGGEQPTYVKTAVGLEQEGIRLVFRERGCADGFSYELQRIDPVTQRISATRVDEIEGRHLRPAPLKRITQNGVQAWIDYHSIVLAEIKEYASAVDRAKEVYLKQMEGENIVWSDSGKRHGHIRRNGLVFHFTFTGDGRMKGYTEIDSRADTGTYEAFRRMARNDFQAEG